MDVMVEVGVGVVEDQVQGGRAHIGTVSAKVASTGDITLEARNQPAQYRLDGLADVLTPVLTSFGQIASSMASESVAPRA